MPPWLVLPAPPPARLQPCGSSTALTRASGRSKAADNKKARIGTQCLAFSGFTFTSCIQVGSLSSSLLHQHAVRPLLIGHRVGDRHDAAGGDEVGQRTPIERPQ